MKTKKTNKKKRLNINFEQTLINWLIYVIESDIGHAFRRFILHNALTSSIIILVLSLTLGILIQDIGSCLTFGGSLIICIGIMSAFEVQKISDTLRTLQNEAISAGKKEALRSKDHNKAAAAQMTEIEIRADLEKMISLSFNKQNVIYSVFLTVLGTFLCGLATLL